MKKSIIYLLGVFLLAIGAAHGQGAAAMGTPVVINGVGQPMAGVTVAICTANPGAAPTSLCTGTLATLYTDITVTTPCTGTLQALNNQNNPSVGSGCSNPGLSDGFGNVVAFSSPAPAWCEYTGSNVIGIQVEVCPFASNSTGGGGGGIGGSGTPGTFPIFVTNSTTLGNSNLTNVSSPNGVNYTLGGGEYWQLDASHLTWDSGIAGSGNIAIANIYAPGSNNNAGGIQILGANATGSACAGGVGLYGGSTNGAGNISSIVANGACSNGFGATGADIVLDAASTSASNGGGNIRLNPGTGSPSGQVIATQEVLTPASSTTRSGLNIGCGSAPSSPANGDLWCTTTGVYGQVNGATVGPFSAQTPNYPPQRFALLSPVSLTANSQTTIISETVTFPSGAGTYRADARYGMFLTTGANACVAEVVESTHAYALSGQNANGTGYIALSASEISTVTYAAGATPTFTLQVICNNGATGLVGATVNSGLFSLTPAEPTYLSVTPILSN